MFFGCPALCYRGMRKAGDWPGLYSRALTQGQYHNRRVLYETAHDSVLSDSNMKPCWLYKGQRLWVGGDNLCRRGGGGQLCSQMFAVQAWGPESSPRTHVKRQAWRSVLITPALGKQGTLFVSSRSVRNCLRQSGGWLLKSDI